MYRVFSRTGKWTVFTLPARHRLVGLTTCRTVSQASVRESEDNVKPFSEVPGPRGLPVIGTGLDWMRKFDVTKVHEILTDRHRQYGPIFKETMGVITTVFITDVQAIEQLFRQEGKYPVRMYLPLWEVHRKDRGHSLGIFLANGEHWQRMRRVVNQPMMKMGSLDPYVGTLNTVATEAIQKLARYRNENQVLQNLDDQLFNWALESVSCILYGRRLGCISDQPDPETQSFIKAVHGALEMTNQLLFYPPWFLKIFMRKTWNTFCSHFDTIFEMAQKCIDAKIEEINKRTNGDDNEIGFIEYMLSQDTINQKDMYANVTDLMGAAVDTTSNTLLWVFHELSQNPDIQEKVFEEAQALVPPGELPSPAHVREMHYLKAVIKETLRMYPVGLIASRVVPNDITILGYKVPAKIRVGMSLYTLGRLPSLWKDPDVFRPERWLRGQNEVKANPYAYLPFGFGPRMCVGRRLAELEMQLFLNQIIRQYRLVAVDSGSIEIKAVPLLVSRNPLRLKLEER